MSKNEGITTKKEQDMADWYQQICLKSELADFGPVKGTLIIRPRGYYIWQQIQEFFNKRLESLNVKNAYFPLFIPESFFKREAEHAEGFAPEVAWITNRDESQERIAIRPTSETIIYDAYSRWVRSHRDLPIKLNQWCNIVRWETEATKLFLRSREFLWQEGHSIYETKEESDKDVYLMLDEYEKVCKELLAIPVIKGKKTEKEKFAGADFTTTIESFMPDGKALQCGTSHQLGQGFAKAFNINFLGKDGEKHFTYNISWGISTRLLGATVMLHSDNKGLVLPPKIAQNKIVIIPILFESSKTKVIQESEKLEQELKQFAPILDTREDYSPGFKFSEWELKGIPIRIELGPKDLEKESVMLVRRDTNEKTQIKLTDLKQTIETTLDDIQNSLYNKAKKHLDESIQEVDSWEDFQNAIKNKKLILANWCNTTECEISIKEKTAGVTTRCLPLLQNPKKTDCLSCGKKTTVQALFSKSY